MKYLIILLMVFLSGCSDEPWKHHYVCLEEKVVDVQVCEGKAGGVVGGALLGTIVAGPIGGIIGAGAGASGESRCRVEKEKQCTKWDYQVRKEWLEWKKKQNEVSE